MELDDLLEQIKSVSNLGMRCIEERRYILARQLFEVIEDMANGIVDLDYVLDLKANIEKHIDFTY
jgi:hypothetical protein